jgi:hypothetical protein
VTFTGTTGQSGTTAVKYRIKQQDPTGPYNVQAVATLGGVSGSNSTSFTVAK